MPTPTTQIMYYGGTGTNPLVRIEITETSTGVFSVKVTQVQATDSDASKDPDGNFYLGDMRGFFIDFKGQETASVSNLKYFENYDAAGTGTSVKKPTVATGNDNVFSVGDSSNNMNGMPSGGDGYDLGIDIGDEGIGKGKTDVGWITFTISGSLTMRRAPTR
jgi:hypothetical protein